MRSENRVRKPSLYHGMLWLAFIATFQVHYLANFAHLSSLNCVYWLREVSVDYQSVLFSPG